MIHAIPNPTKKITIDFSLESVKRGFLRIPQITQEKYKLTSQNEMFHQITLEAFELLSLGVYVDINLTKVDDNKTEILIEVRRKIGSFDQQYEVTKANDHIQTLIKTLSEVISLSESDFQSKISELPKQKTGCFVATATMGDYNHPVVLDLRSFRDNWLENRAWGRSFIKSYYTHGPKFADLIAKSKVAQKITFNVLIRPLHFIANKLNG